MGIFASLKVAGNKAKIQGEMTLLDREAKARQQLFGVELYDLLSVLDQGLFHNTPMLLGTQSQSIKEVYSGAQVEVRQFVDERDAKEGEIEHLQANRDRALPVTGTQEKLKRAGEWTASNASETKLHAESALLKRKIRQRKEVFGVQVFLLLDASTGGGGAGGTSGDKKKKSGGLLGGVKAGLGGVTSGLSNQIAKLSGPEKEITQCIDGAQADVAVILKNKERKQREIDDLLREAEM